MIYFSRFQALEGPGSRGNEVSRFAQPRGQEDWGHDSMTITARPSDKTRIRGARRIVPTRTRQTIPRHFRQASTRESGTILLIVLFVAVAMSGLIFVGGIVLASYKTRSETEFRALGQARNVARSGLIDAFSWFRRQTTQPVTQFAPVRDEESDPPVLDTEDPAVGLVRHFEISGDVWARYEVRKYDPNDPRLEVRDVSLLRGLPGHGQAWYLACWGTVYRRVNPENAFHEPPNRILGTARAFTEIRRITLAPPGQAAINARNGENVMLLYRSRVRGNEGAAVVFPLGTGEPIQQGEISGSPALAPVADYEDSPEAVFGVPYEQLKSLADDIITNPAEFPSPVPRESLLIVEGDVTFDNNKPLRGTGVVYVQGHCTVGASPHNFFNGLLYVEGDLVIRAPSLLRGSIVVTGTVEVLGSGDYAEIEYDQSVLNSLMVAVGQYRIARAMRFLD
jgi:hypothetical protein